MECQVAHRDGHTMSAPDPMAEVCPRCGAIDRALLSPGTGPHACRASCQHCGRFIKWISLLAPSERLARKAKARLQAMQHLPPTVAQLAYLQALGDPQSAPTTRAEASTRIDALKRRNAS
jgi:hypothetical protein